MTLMSQQSVQPECSPPGWNHLSPAPLSAACGFPVGPTSYLRAQEQECLIPYNLVSNGIRPLCLADWNKLMEKNTDL